jgi:hypothetical protein
MYTLYIHIYYIYPPLYTDSRSIQGPILSSPTRHANCPVLAFGKLNEGGISCAWVQEVFTRSHPKQERCFGWLQYLNILIYLIYTWYILILKIEVWHEAIRLWPWMQFERCICASKTYKLDNRPQPCLRIAKGLHRTGGSFCWANTAVEVFHGSTGQPTAWLDPSPDPHLLHEDVLGAFARGPGNGTYRPDESEINVWCTAAVLEVSLDDPSVANHAQP